MFELFHAVFTSLLLSAGLGCGVGQAAGDDEPIDSENGVDVGAMPSYLNAPRGQSTAPAELGDEDDLSPALTTQTFFCEPTIVAGVLPAAQQAPHAEVAFWTSGRSP